MTKFGAVLSDGALPAGEAFPVGSVFIAVVATDPATLLGYGTWSAFGAGRILVGLDSGDTDFDVVEETGGAKTVQSTGSNAAEAAHTHAAGAISWPVGVPTNAAHTHDNHTTANTKDASTGSATTKLTGPVTHSSIAPVISWPVGVPTGAASNAGSSHNHVFTGNATSVVQPYIVCYFWKRTV